MLIQFNTQSFTPVHTQKSAHTALAVKACLLGGKQLH